VLGLSPAIDSGDPAGCPDLDGVALRVDQRCVSRPRDGNEDGLGACDVGAVEVPEPGAVALGITVFGGLAALVRRVR
jgi:hypothetical protein